MLSVGTIHFEVTIVGGGRVSAWGPLHMAAWGAVHMAAALAGCRKDLVGIGLAISLLFDIIVFCFHS